MKIDETIDAAFSPILEFAGFEAVRPRKWVRDVKAPIRELFHIQAIKGGQCSALWGFSLDFVPLFRQSRFRWHRTNKSCEFDLCIDPIDTSGNVPALCSFTAYHFLERACLEAVAHRAVRKALADFARVDGLSALELLFQERSELQCRRFSFRNYVQVHLAWGLLLIALGRADEAELKLQEFCDTHGADRDHPFLARAIAGLAGHPARCSTGRAQPRP